MEDKPTRKEALDALVRFVRGYANEHPQCSKDAVAKAVAKQFELRLERKVYVGPQFAVRFCWSSKQSFSGTVLGLSVLKKYDLLPFVVCLVRPSGVELFLANSTFIDKASHSSHRISPEQIRGSFNGSNIIRSFDDLNNEPANFERLFEEHLRIGFEENYERIVENTVAIRGRGARFAPTLNELSAILTAPEIATTLLDDSPYQQLMGRLNKLVERNRQAILTAATSPNVNLRGNAIEQIVTTAGNLHRTEDLAEAMASGVTVYIDIKTKLIGFSSNPAAYNIDKLLRLLAPGKAAFSFLFIGIDVANQTVASKLISFLDTSIISATRIQPHWAGRNSRGGTQLTGDLSQIFAPDFRESIDTIEARTFLQRLIAL